MNKTRHSRRISSEKLRAILTGLAEEICNVQERVTLAISGNTFEIHLEGGTVNISLNEQKGGEI